MSLPRFSVNNHVLVNMGMIVVLVVGGFFSQTLIREMFPETRPNKLAIVAVYPAVQPQELEKAVTIKVEEAVRDVEGVEKVDSSVSSGLSNTTLSLFNDVDDVDVVLQEVKNEIDAIEDLPDDLEKITVTKFEPKLPVISVAIFGDGDEADLKRAARSMRDDLLTLPGVSDVEIGGTRDDEISVEVRPERLLEYNITFDEVAAAIRETNVDISGGQLKGDRTSRAVRTLGEKSRGVDLESLVVRSEPDGRELLLSDVAYVRDAFVESDLESYFNAKPAVNCVVYKTKSQDAIQIATLVKAYVAGKQNAPFDAHGFDGARSKPWYVRPFTMIGAGLSWGVTKVTGKADPATVYEESRNNPLPHGFEVALHTDLARFVEGRLDLMTRNGKTGLLLVLISLNLFLNWRVAFWAALGLPVSLFGTFIVMWVFGLSLNLLSMFGMIIVLGIIVDDAIVIGENIYRHIEEGEPPREAAIRGAEEVMWPVTIAVLTTIAAFAPLLFIRGRIGDFMGELPIVVLAALSVSLVEALVILPAHLSNLPSRRKRDRERISSRHRNWLRRFSASYRAVQERLLHGSLLRIYERFLRFALRWRYVTLSFAVSLCIIAIGLISGGIVEAVFIQKMDSETLICRVEMPVGTPADQLKTRMKTLAEYVDAAPEVVNAQMYVSLQVNFGGDGAVGARSQSHLGQFVVELRPADERESLEQRSSEELLADFRQFSMALPGVNSVTWEGMNGGPAGRDIHIQVSGSDFDEIVGVGDEIKTHLASYGGVFDLEDDFEEGKREVQLELRESARPTGITVGSLGNQVRSALYGSESRRITRNREDVKIMVRYPEDFRKDIYNLESMWIPTGNNPLQRGWVPLSEVAYLVEADSFTTIHRSRQQRSVSVYGAVDQEVGQTDMILAGVRETFENEIRPKHPGVRIEFLGSHEEQTKSFSALKYAFPVALLMIYMMLAGLFRSYLQPLVVMSAIPFGFLGAVVGHWATDNPMTILSWIGLVALSGILVNDSLVLVDFINKRIARGMSQFEANIEGAKLRLRAILLTTLTTVAGLTPLMFETSFQAKFLIPMAVTLTFGLVFATALTLIIVPALNMVFYDMKSLGRRAIGRSAIGGDESKSPDMTRQTHIADRV